MWSLLLKSYGMLWSVKISILSRPLPFLILTTLHQDVRLICAVLLRYFDTPIVETDEAKLSALDAYYVPMAHTLEDVKSYMRTLPLDEDPRVFGLHPNAMITAQVMASRLFLSTVESVQPRLASGGGGKKPEDIVSDMAREFFERIPEPMKAKWASEETYRRTPEGSVFFVLAAMLLTCRPSDADSFQ